MISHRNGCNYRSIEKKHLTLPDTILEDPQTHAVTWLVHTPMHRNRSKCMYDSFNTYICIYIYTHTHGKMSDQKFSKKAQYQHCHTIIEYHLYHLSSSLEASILVFQKIFGKTHWGVEMSPPFPATSQVHQVDFLPPYHLSAVAIRIARHAHAFAHLLYG